MKKLKKQGVQYIAPPMFALVREQDNQILPSDYAKAAQEAARQTEARLRVAGVTAWSKANKDGKPSTARSEAGVPGARPRRPDLP